MADVPVLIRPHPYNCAAWERADFSNVPEVAIWPRRAYNPVEETSRNGFYDSLHHSAAVVGINTSAMIEAAILGRPVLSLRTTEFAGTQEGTLHFHYLLPENGGFLRVAATLDEHVAQLAHALGHAEAMRAETARFVGSFIRPHGVDASCTPRVADAIETLGRAGRQPSQPSPWWAPALWPALFAGYVVAGGWWLVSDAKARRTVRKKLDARARRMRKNVTRAQRLLLGRR
jgi:hypothetical protein